MWKRNDCEEEKLIENKIKMKVEGSILKAEGMLIEKQRLANREKFLKIQRELRCAGLMLEWIAVPMLGRSAKAAPHANVSQPTFSQK